MLKAVSDSRRFSTGKQRLDSKFLKGKKHPVGKVNLPVFQNVFLFIVAYSTKQGNSKCWVNRKW